jgi:hypothetical protein
VRPRADFSCAHCTKASGTDTVIPNLPIASKRCPMCGHARGFKRLFNKVMTANGRGRKVARVLDPMMTPAVDRHHEVKASAKRFEQAVLEGQDRAYEKAPPHTREAMVAAGKGIVGRPVPAGAALSQIPQDARRDTASMIYPALTGRRVRPLWEQRR